MSNIDTEKYFVAIGRHKETGNVVSETWANHSGQRHRLDGPAEREFDKDTGRLLREQYWRDGKPYSPDGQAHLTEWGWDSDIVIMQVWAEKGKIGRSGDLPARIHRNEETGVMISEEWLSYGSHHRNDDKPAVIERDKETGQIVVEEWYSHGNLFREDLSLPTRVEYDQETGKPVIHEFHWVDVLHREDGPARIEFDPQTGQETSEAFYLDGEQYEKLPANDRDPQP